MDITILSTVVAVTIMLGGYILHDTRSRLTTLETMAIEVARSLATLTEQGRGAGEKLAEIGESIKSLPCHELWDHVERRCKT